MKKKFLLMGVLVVLIGVLGVSYAFFGVGGKQSLANSFSSGCLNINIYSEVNNINLDNQIPIIDTEGLDNTPFTSKISVVAKDTIEENKVIAFKIIEKKAMAV